MPTIFDRLSSAVDGNGLSVSITTQSGKLTQVATTVAGLIEHPPHDIGDLGAALQTLPLPDLQVSGDFAKTLNALMSAVPTDLSSVTGELTGGLSSLQGQLAELAGPLGRVLGLAMAIYQVTQVDLFCMGAPGSPPSPAAPLPSPLTHLNDILDKLPSPLSVTGLLSWMDQLLHNLDTTDFLLVEIPLLDALRYPLMTLMNWRNMPSVDILTSMADALGDLELLISGAAGAPLAPVEAALSALNDQWPAAALGRIADDLVTRLGNVRAAIHNVDVSGTGADVAALNAQLDNYAVVQQSVQNALAPDITTLNAQLPVLATDLLDQVGSVSALLHTDSPLSLLPAQPANALAASGLSGLEEYLASLTERLQALVDQLDLSAIQGPLADVANGMQQAVDALDAAQVKVTLQVQSLFANVQTLVNQVDTHALLASVESAIANFKTTLVNQLQTLFAPVRAAVSKVIDEISQGVHDFDPSSIQGALKDAIDKLAGVLKDPDVVSAIQGIRDAIDQTAKALESLSFAPLTDQVIADIQQLTESLKKIDMSQLSMPLQLALQAALAILPSDLTPLSNPLIQQLQTLIDEGPAPLLQTLQQQPQRLLNEVRKYEPATLLGDALSVPYGNLLQQMNAFKPSALLDPVQAELDTLKNRLRASADPGRLIQPLEGLFDQLLRAFDSLRPEALVAPLNQALGSVIHGVMQALPIDETFNQIDKVLHAIQQIASIGDRTVALLQRMIGMLGELANPRQQMDAWLSDTLANLHAIADPSSLQPALDAVNTALTNIHAAALTARFATAADPLLDKLNTLGAQPKLVAVIQAYNAISMTEVNHLPDSQQKTDILALLNRFNPVNAAFGAPYQASAHLQSLLSQAKTSLQVTMTNWDARFHEDGPLATLRNLQATTANLQQWATDALEAQFARPITTLLAMATPLSQTLQGMLARLQSPVGVLDAKLNTLLQGPNSLTSIRDTLGALVQKLQGLNLNFIADSLKPFFADLRGKLTAISPAQLRQAIDAAFNAMLDALQVSLLISQADLAKLDDDYKVVLDDLKKLDPGAMIKDAGQDFEKQVIPLLAVFDPSDLLKALYNQFTRVDESLKAEIARINQAYQALRDAIPSISISIDIGVSVPSF